MDETSGIKILQKNKKAHFEYEITDTYETGIVLLGYEVKSVRNQQVLFADSFARISKKGEMFIHNLHISQYKYYTLEVVDPVRPRKLLLKKEELKKIQRKIEEKGCTLVPIQIYIKRSLIKILVGVGKGKKLYDKKETIKKRMAEREMNREAKEYLKK